MGKVHITVSETGRLIVQFHYSSERVKAIKGVPGSFWHADRKYWSVPNTTESLSLLRSRFSRDRVVASKKVFDTLPRLDENQVDSIIQRFDAALTSRGYSQKTCDDYRLHIQWFLGWFRRAPAEASSQDVQAYIVWLIDLGRSASFVRQAKAALTFLFKGVEEKPETVMDLPSVKAPKALPLVLSKEEIARLLAAADNIKERALLSLTYSAGLRISEVTRLRLSDILSNRSQVRVRGGKGKKDRYTLLSNQTLQTLRAYYGVRQPKEWLFAGTLPKKPLSISAAERIFQRARKKSRINPDATMHSLRHSFATH